MKKSKTKRVFKFVIEENVWITTNLKGCEFENDWLKVESDGTITVKGSNFNGYAWDGCSPKWNCLHITWGTPDGKLDYRTRKPMTYYASMIHDALYQFKDSVCVTRKETDILFTIILKEAGFMLWWIYNFGVRIGGVFYGKWKMKKSRSGIRITELSWLK